MKRVCLIVLDSVGIGALPDAAEFGDAGSHTLGNIYGALGGLELPNLYRMGLGNITDARLTRVDRPTAAYCRLAEATKAKDTTSGHWEMAGVIMDKPFLTYPSGFPRDIMDEFEAAAGTKALGGVAASGTEIIELLGEEHMKTGCPIVYTSADSVFQIAAHEGIIPLKGLYGLCETAFKTVAAKHGIGRVIARPFAGVPGAFYRTENRRDFSVKPIRDTVLNSVSDAGQTVYAIGKIEDIFSGSGITQKDHSKNNRDGVAATLKALGAVQSGLIFTNLVDFDMLYGHRNDVAGYAGALKYFDGRLPEITAALRDDDLLIITADHGCDPTTPSTDHSREYIPMLAYGSHIKPVDLGTRETFADIAATINEYLGLGAWREGKSFLAEILAEDRRMSAKM